MNCEDFLPLLYDFVDEELEEEDKRELQTHLAQCSACRLELESIRAAEMLFRKETAIAPPPGIEARITSNLLENASLQTRRIYSPSRRAAFIGMAASILAAAVYLASLLPESVIFTARAKDLTALFNPGWGEGVKALAEIRPVETIDRLINAFVEYAGTLGAAGEGLPSAGGFTLAIILGLVALQIAGSYRLLGEDK